MDNWYHGCHIWVYLHRYWRGASIYWSGNSMKFTGQQKAVIDTIIDQVAKTLEEKRHGALLGSARKNLEFIVPLVLHEASVISSKEMFERVEKLLPELEEKKVGTKRSTLKKKSGREFNFVIGEVDVPDSIFDGEDFVQLPVFTDMFSILVEAGIFPSRGQARKNWNKTGKDVPAGLTDIEKIGKMNTRITIWNPTGGTQ